mgnify:CR=1 FL=1
MIEKLKQDVQELANPERAEHSKRYFKTGPGQYGEGDVFLGLTMPQQREIAKKYKDLQLEQVQELLESGIHTYRMIALVILTLQYKNNNEEIFNFYLKNTKYINNWDLVDVTTHKIVGEYLLDKPRDILYKLAKSPDLWEKRISIISTFAFIRRGQLDDAINIAEILLHDKHDLIHKAVGWMLREIGNRDLGVEEKFLKKYYNQMPRTMLRYAIEKFEESKRLDYLKGRI